MPYKFPESIHLKRNTNALKTCKSMCHIQPRIPARKCRCAHNAHDNHREHRWSSVRWRWCTLTGVSWSLLYWAKAPDAPSFNRLSLFSRTLTSLNTSLNSPGGECNIKSETIRTFSWSGITTSPSAAILPFPLARWHAHSTATITTTTAADVKSEDTTGYGVVVTDRPNCPESFF